MRDNYTIIYSDYESCWHVISSQHGLIVRGADTATKACDMLKAWIQDSVSKLAEY